MPTKPTPLTTEPAPKKESFKNCTELRKKYPNSVDKGHSLMIQSMTVIKMDGLVKNKYASSYLLRKGPLQSLFLFSLTCLVVALK